MNNTMNFCSIDPGKQTGIALFDQYGKLLDSFTLHYQDHEQYSKALQEAKLRHFIQFALIERFTPFIGKQRKGAHSVQTQMTICQEVFSSHVLIYTSQWNPRAYKGKFKRTVWAPTVFQRLFPNDHQCDAAIMGTVIWTKTVSAIGEAFNALWWLARTKKSWPTLREESLCILWERMKRAEAA